MDPQLVLSGAQDALTVRRIFGDPIQVDGSTIVPVAKVRGGGGAGVYVFQSGTVRWRPAVDVNRVILGGQIVGIVALLTLGPVLRLALSRWLNRDASSAPGPARRQIGHAPLVAG